MILHIFSVYDRATVQFGTPMFLVSRGHAIRSFGDEINNAKSSETNLLALHADDFDLYALGQFDTDSGVFSLLARPEQVVLGKDLKVKTS